MTRFRVQPDRILLCLIVALGTMLTSLRAGESPQRDGRWGILVAGISGDPSLQAEYLKQLRDLRGILENQYHFRREQVFVLFDDVSKDAGLVQYRSDRENLTKVCHEVASRAQKDDFVFVFLAGHGSFDGMHYKLNLVGPDPTAEELAGMLYAIPAHSFLVVNTTTCSGASLKALSGPGRVVITATKSGNEGNQTHLSGYFVEALSDNKSDVDKDGRVSILEAFKYAVSRVEEYYSKEGNLQTEHPLLDDNGDGEGHANPAPENGDGLIARTTYLDQGPILITNAAPANEEQRKFALEAQSLEKQIEALKYAKAGMPEAEYEKKLEELLLKLAQVNAKLRRD